MSEIVLKEATVVQIRSGDVVLFRLPECISDAEHDRLEQELKRVFPKNEVVVLGAASSLEIVREEDVR